jgi:uncharacterized protein (TIGR02996 family)
MPYLELSDGKSHKFWEITREGKKLTTRWGRIGAAGQSKVETLGSVQAAEMSLFKQVTAKSKKGYREKPQPGAAKPAVAAAPALRDEKLEAAIREHRDSAPAYLVYSDWLVAQNQPLGELIAAQQARDAGKPDAREKKLVAKLGLPNSKHAEFGWRWGMLDWVHLRNDDDWMDDAFEALPVAQAVFGSPACAALRELRVGILRWDYNEKDVPMVLAEAGKHAFAAGVERLHLGAIPSDIDMDHQIIGDIGRVITKSFPSLTWLKLKSGGQGWRGTPDKNFSAAGLSLPKLRELTVETCAMTKKRLTGLLESSLPALESLELWFGSGDAGVNVKLDQLRPLFDDKLFPKLTHLGLCNTELVDEIVDELPRSKRLPKLRSLDLSKGTLDDAGARTLAQHAKAFSHLERIDVRDNWLSKAAVTSLRNAFGARIDARNQNDDEGDPEMRFVAVGE